MKSFALDENGDLLISNGQIQMVFDENLIRQKVKTVLSTNKNEWFLNVDEGINFRNILGKNVDREELIENEISQGLLQIDESFTITSFKCDIDSVNRRAVITFSATYDNGEIEDLTLNIE